ncbi:putative ferric-chelate reductase 1 [Leuresthes tenuis]|uniref:putative ferric-chelate reductase 1 n=1 Tax=Leuresthes tenuis TaxID=355514 RepID=UPI003B511706
MEARVDSPSLGSSGDTGGPAADFTSPHCPEGMAGSPEVGPSTRRPPALGIRSLAVRQTGPGVRPFRAPPSHPRWMSVYLKALLCYLQGTHPVLGCLVMVLSLLQPIMALLRCGPQHPLRFLFNWSHALNGVAIKALAVAAIFTGLKLIDSTMDRWLMKVMSGFVGWEALFFIMLEFLLKWKANKKGEVFQVSPLQTTKRGMTLITADILLMTPYFMGNLAFLVALLVGIGVS